MEKLDISGLCLDFNANTADHGGFKFITYVLMAYLQCFANETAAAGFAFRRFTGSK
jgi:hypothetical protein